MLLSKSEVIDMTGARLTSTGRRFAILLVVAFCVYGGDFCRAAGEPPVKTGTEPDHNYGKIPWRLGLLECEGVGVSFGRWRFKSSLRQPHKRFDHQDFGKCFPTAR